MDIKAWGGLTVQPTQLLQVSKGLQLPMQSLPQGLLCFCWDWFSWDEEHLSQHSTLCLLISKYMALRPGPIARKSM